MTLRLARPRSPKRQFFADVEKNEKVAILGIEAGGRMHKHFHRLIDTFAKFKADADAGTPTTTPAPPRSSFTNRFFRARNLYSWAGSKSRA